MAKPRHIYQAYIKASPERVWQAIVDRETNAKYSHGAYMNVDEWRAGTRYTMTLAGGQLVAEGEIIECEPSRRLVVTFHALWSPEVAAERPTLHTWDLEAAGEVCRVTVTIESPDDEPSALFEQASGGIAAVVSGLKTLVETGEVLEIG